MLLILLILSHVIIGHNCEKEIENATISSDVTLNITEAGVSPPKQEALTFLRPTIVEGPSLSDFLERHDKEPIVPKFSKEFLEFFPKLKKEFSPQSPRSQVPGRRSKPTRYDDIKETWQPSTFVRNGEHGGRRFDSRPPLRSRPSGIDRMDTFSVDPYHLDYPEYLMTESSYETDPVYHVQYSGDVNMESYPTLDTRDSSIPAGDVYPFNPKDKSHGSLQAALRSLWMYKKKAYETLYARSEAQNRNVKQSNYGGRLNRRRKPTRRKVDNIHTPIPGIYSPSDHAQVEEPDISLSLEHLLNVDLSPSRGLEFSPPHEFDELFLEDETSLASPPFFDSSSRQARPFQPHKKYPPKERSFVGGIFSRVKNFFSGDTTKGKSYQGRGPYRNRPLHRRGHRSPRMQLVKRSDRNFLLDQNDAHMEVTTVNNLPAETVDNPGTIDDNHMTTDDSLIVNVALVDEQGHHQPEEVYAYYMDEDTTNTVHATERMDKASEDYNDYNSDYNEYNNDYKDYNSDYNRNNNHSSDHNMDYYYYEDENELSVIDGEVVDSSDEYLEVEYLDDYEYYDEETPDDLDSPGVSRMGLENDSSNLNRQGLLGLSLFGDKKKDRPNRKKRPPPQHKQTSFPSHPQPTTQTSSYSNYPSKPSTPPSLSHPLSPKGNKKNIRLRIKSKKNPRRKRIRMKILGVPSSSSSDSEEDGNWRHNQFTSSYTHYEGSKEHGLRQSESDKGAHLYRHADQKPWRNRNSDQKRKKANRPNLYGTKRPGYGGTKSSGYGHGMMMNMGYGSYGGSQSTGYGGLKTSGYGGYGEHEVQQGIKGSAGWAALQKMSNSLPDLNKAITVMSFIAFSVFVANLGVNAIANNSVSFSFGRDSGLSQWYNLNPDFSIDGLIHNLDQLLESTDEHSDGSISTFDSIVNLVTAVYNDLYEVTKAEMVNAREKVMNFLQNDFSENNLPLGDVSKGFLSRKLDTGDPFGQLDDTCYRELLCLSHDLTRTYRNGDARNKLLPFWTFGVGWLKEGESHVPTLLENLRAELAGQSGRDCRKLFAPCSNQTLVNDLLADVKEDLVTSVQNASTDINEGTMEETTEWEPISVSVYDSDERKHHLKELAPLFSRMTPVHFKTIYKEENVKNKGKVMMSVVPQRGI